jgi:hypothetical protein
MAWRVCACGYGALMRKLGWRGARGCRGPWACCLRLWLTSGARELTWPSWALTGHARASTLLAMRGHVVKVLLSDEEFAELTRRRGDVPASLFVRKILLGRAPSEPAPKPDVPAWC